MTRLRAIGFCLGLALAAQPHPGAAQTARIGFLEPGSLEANRGFLDAFREGLLALGWAEGRNIEILDRWAEARPDRLPEIVDELIRSKVDVLVTGATPATLAAKSATTTIPIVSVGASDLVTSGIVESLAHPGGNVTGVMSLSIETVPKGIELLREAVPTLTRLAFLWNPEDPDGQRKLANAENASRALGLTLLPLDAATPEAIERGFAELPQRRADAIFVVISPLAVAKRTRIVELAAGQRLPLGSNWRGFTNAGAMLSSGADLPEVFRQAARLVDKVLRGARPADLPVEQPVTEIVVNLKSAKALGVAIPQSIVGRADEVIE